MPRLGDRRPAATPSAGEMDAPAQPRGGLRGAPLCAALLACGMATLGCGPSPSGSPDATAGWADAADPAGSADSGAPGTDASGATCGQTSPGDHAIRVVYLIPADRELDPARADGLWSAVLHLRAWFAEHSIEGETFRLAGGVEYAELPHEEAWYATHDAGGSESSWFVENVLADAIAATGAEPGEELSRWLFFIDAPHGCGQVGRRLSDGMAVFNGNDLRRLIGAPTLSPCSGEASGEPRCPTVGFLGFMIGSTVGLRYPDGCADDDGGTACSDEWLYNGAYEAYPEATLAPDNQARLGASPFFEPMELSGCPASCSSP